MNDWMCEEMEALVDDESGMSIPTMDQIIRWSLGYLAQDGAPDDLRCFPYAEGGALNRLLIDGELDDFTVAWLSGFAMGCEDETGMYLAHAWAKLPAHDRGRAYDRIWAHGKVWVA